VHGLQSGGSQALAELAYDLEAKDKIVAAGGLEAVFRALNRHRSVTETQVPSTRLNCFAMKLCNRTMFVRAHTVPKGPKSTVRTARRTTLVET
jgi:hypothetical protein